MFSSNRIGMVRHNEQPCRFIVGFHSRVLLPEVSLGRVRHGMGLTVSIFENHLQ